MMKYLINGFCTKSEGISTGKCVLSREDENTFVGGIALNLEHVRSGMRIKTVILVGKGNGVFFFISMPTYESIGTNVNVSL